MTAVLDRCARWWLNRRGFAVVPRQRWTTTVTGTGTWHTVGPSTYTYHLQ